MEPPIQGLKRLSMVLLLAMSFSLMLCERGGALGITGGTTGSNWEAARVTGKPPQATGRDW